MPSVLPAPDPPLGSDETRNQSFMKELHTLTQQIFRDSNMPALAGEVGRARRLGACAGAGGPAAPAARALLAGRLSARSATESGEVAPRRGAAYAPQARARRPGARGRGGEFPACGQT